MILELELNLIVFVPASCSHLLYLCLFFFFIVRYYLFVHIIMYLSYLFFYCSVHVKFIILIPFKMFIFLLPPNYCSFFKCSFLLPFKNFTIPMNMVYLRSCLIINMWHFYPNSTISNASSINTTCHEERKWFNFLMNNFWFVIVCNLCIFIMLSYYVGKTLHQI